MKTVLSKIAITALLVATSLIIYSCDSNNSGPKDLFIESITVNGEDLNGAVSPSDIPTNANIVITFNTDIDAATANASTISLIQDYDNTVVDLTIEVSANMVTITPNNELGTGILYLFELKPGLMNTDEQPIGQTARTFTTTGTFAPSGMIANWTFEDNAEDVVGSYNPTTNGVVDITYTASRNTDAGNAATFNGNTSIIEIPNGDLLMNAEDFTLSFWVKTNSEGHVDASGNPTGHFVMGLGAFFGFAFEIDGGYSSVKMPTWIGLNDGTTRGGGDLLWLGDGLNADNGGWQGTVVNDEEDMPALLQDRWLQVVFVFDGSEQTRSIYIDGVLRIQHDYSLWPEDATERLANRLEYGGAEPDVVNELAFGFVHSRAGTMWDQEPWGGYDFPTANHFKGQLDDIKIYHKVLTDTEIQLMYDSEL